MIQLVFGNREHQRFAELVGLLRSTQLTDYHDCGCRYCDFSDLECSNCDEPELYQFECSNCGTKHHSYEQKEEAIKLFCTITSGDRSDFNKFLKTLQNV